MPANSVKRKDLPCPDLPSELLSACYFLPDAAVVKAEVEELSRKFRHHQNQNPCRNRFPLSMKFCPLTHLRREM